MEPRVVSVDEVVVSVDVVHVDIVVVTPVSRPWLGELEPVAAVVEAAVIAALDMEVVFATKVGAEVFVTDPADVAVASIALGLLPVVALVALDLLYTLARGFVLLGAVLFGLLLLFGGVFLLLFRLLRFGLPSALGILPLLGAVWFASVSLLLFWFLLTRFLRSGLVSILFAIGFPFPFFLLGRLLFLPIGFLAIDGQAHDEDEHCCADCQSHGFSVHQSLLVPIPICRIGLYALRGHSRTGTTRDELQRGEKLRNAGVVEMLGRAKKSPPP
jgi:hypothetical protein